MTGSRPAPRTVKPSTEMAASSRRNSIDTESKAVGSISRVALWYPRVRAITARGRPGSIAAAPVGTGSVNVPSRPVSVPVDVPETMTWAPTSGRPSDALTAPYDCALAHHVNALPSRLSLIASRIGSLPDDVREAFFEYRDEGLRSLWPVFGRIAHEVYAYPWVIFESDFSRYGSIGDLLEKSVEARVERDRPFVITTRSDVLLEGRSEGRVPVVIDRKLSGYTESMRHSHRTQLALTLAAYRERITADGDHMPYGIGIVDASAPYHPHPSGYRPQRFTARLFTNDEISESLERACDVALRRDAIRTRDDVLSAKQASAAYRTGPKGGRAASLCSSCGVYRSDGSVKGSLATRLACDTLTES